MIGEPDLVRLLYDADWTKLSLPADVIRLTSVTEDGVMAGFEPEPPPWVRRSPWMNSRLGDNPRQDLRTLRTTERLLIAPGGRCRVERAGEESCAPLRGHDGERAWWEVKQHEDESEVRMFGGMRPVPRLLSPSWLLAGFVLELDGETVAGGRHGYRITATRRPGHEPRSGTRPQTDRVEAIVDAELGILLRCEETGRGQTLSVEELQDVTIDPPEAAGPAQFAPPPGSTVSEGCGELFNEPGLSGAKAAAGGAAAGPGFAIKHAPRAQQPAGGGDAAMPPDEPDAEAPDEPGTAAGQPRSSQPLRDVVLHVLYRSGLAPQEFTAEFHEWFDPSVAMQAIRSAESRAGIRGLGILADAISDRGSTAHRSATIRVAGLDRYRIDYLSGVGKRKPKTIACDGQRRWRVFGDRAAVGPAAPLSREFAQLIDPCWLLARRLSDKGEVTVRGRRGFRLSATRNPDGIGPWPAPAHVMFSTAEAVVDAELGILLQATTAGHAAVLPRCSRRSAIHTLMIDWRVMPRRFASMSSDSIIHSGKSTFTRRCSSPGRRAPARSRADVTSSPRSNSRSNSSAFIDRHLLVP
ncbi:MAG TPA: hypothetical protein VKV80_00165 [Streptosporangiaceae bacterium]|nr:hypothetical protein [Streptosporangiaceae bacterium]